MALVKLRFILNKCEYNVNLNFKIFVFLHNIYELLPCTFIPISKVSKTFGLIHNGQGILKDFSIN